ncbi:related to DNA helicase [Cephalotrichum gorgonifer]|uniref:DNA replication ATP-dependent helicase/nuclease n=1 Tax=Cephalotrichum gorgonifer TaxID=2041049 RepID=A0AAE8SXR7_9PEZI|nr:related to DNA helicase [Cephalotrichum gorgonifer]
MSQAGQNPPIAGNPKRGPWQRSYSTPVRPKLDRTPSTISSATRKKLEKLKFKPKTPKPQPEATIAGESDKENVATEAGPVAATAVEKEDAARADWTKLPSATPVSKQDWLRPGESGGRAEEDDRNVSPDDRLMWAAMQDDRESAYPHLLGLARRKKGRKRARSSSPTSSPMGKANSPVINIKKLAQALKSPHPDPTLDLWDRYTLGVVGESDAQDTSGLGLNGLFPTSSPRPAVGNLGVTPQKESALRKAVASTRLHFNKRRKIEVEEDAPTETRVRVPSKHSLVTSLLDSVTSSMQEPQGSQEPSPLSKKENSGHVRQRLPAESPSPKKRKGSSPPSSPPRPKGLEAAPEVANISGLGESDYEDDDFDDDTFMAIDAQIGSAPVMSCGGARGATTAAQPTADAVKPPEQRRSRQSPRKSPRKTSYPPHKAISPAQVVPSEDDYGLDDDDLDDDTLMELADQVVPMNSSVPRPLDSTRNNLPTTKVQATTAEPTIEDDLLDDDFGDDADWDAVELAATQAVASQPAKPQSTLRPSNVSGSIPMLALEADMTKKVRVVLLRGDWYDTEAHANSWVHIIGDFDGNGQCVIDDTHNMLILHPDQLISATVVADSFGCMRRAVLQDRVKATSDPTPPLVYGTLLHEIFQEALAAMRWDPLFLTKVIKTTTEKHVEDLYTIKVGMEQARAHLESKMDGLRGWATAFVSAEPKPAAVVQDRKDKKVNMCISKLLDVEEHVWSPMYGLKGNIDATVQVTIKDGNQSQTLTVPFEVKTGKHANSHHTAQTALYNLLLSDRYDIDVASGILYYMENSLTMRIPTVRQELRHMIMQRNRLAAYIRERSVQLPPMMKRQNLCGRCYAKTSCFIYHRLADNGDGETSGMGEKFNEVVRHLTPKHSEFFLKWENLLTMEEKETQKFKRELWTMMSEAREKLGRCFGDVVIDQVLGESDTSKINRFQYSFVKHSPAPGFSFLESQLVVGEPIVVSDEKGHFALGLGYVTAVRKHRITVAVDRRLHNTRIRQPGFDEVNNQVFAGIMEVGRQRPSDTADTAPPIRYRIDKDEFSNGMATVRNNLVQIMADGVFGAQSIRRLVVDLEPPTFKAAATQYETTGHDSLNIDQKRAVEKVMSAQDYALVLGMPGTGKTTTIAHLIRALTQQGKSVLLTSYTHTAVDNILLKLKADKMSILRLGAPAKVHPEVQEFTTLAGHPMSSFEQIKEAWLDSPVVATTCLGINHPLFNERTFDYCIVDEASQITLPICLGPIRMARTFVLVGDHNQLPPLVQNEKAREGGLDVSLFKLLSETHPDSVVNLEHQYRMCEDVMTLSNTLIYGGRLRCGTEELRTRSLEIPDMAALKQRHYDATTLARSDAPRSVCTGGRSCWLRQALSPEARVRFLNTDTLFPRVREEAKGNRIVNPAEAQIITQLVDALLTTGVPASEIGVMTHYRSQLSLLKHSLRHTGVEMHTADRFQGRDKEVVVLSLVRCNEAGSIGDLLRDWRRINVAFTRAKTKLLVVGSKDTLGANPAEMVGRFVELMVERRWVADLPPDALAGHYFEEGPSQSQWLSPGKTPLKALSPLKATTSPGKKGGMRSPGVARRKLFGAGGGGGLGVEGELDKENAGPRRAGMAEGMVLKKMLVGRDVLNELTGGRFAH